MQIIAIDGPVGAGKSTIAKLLAGRLGYAYIDTGAMYRAIGWKAYTTEAPISEGSLEKLCDSTRLDIELTDSQQRVIVDGKDITDEIRTPEISRMSSVVSAYASVRRYLVKLQRDTGISWAKRYGGVIAEGRDMGTVVFPDAAFKFYLDADIVERGKRRWKELQDKGMEAELSETVKGIEERDANDKGREIDPLRKAEGAIIIDTTGLSVEEVVEEMLRKIKGKSFEN
ncbi:MAG: (d)CMP kinase [Nitrospirae bacterium]|nr:(d)CMP kinase [Nitrospirota bacterium]